VSLSLIAPPASWGSHTSARYAPRSRRRASVRRSGSGPLAVSSSGLSVRSCSRANRSNTSSSIPAIMGAQPSPNARTRSSTVRPAPPTMIGGYGGLDRFGARPAVGRNSRADRGTRPYPSSRSRSSLGRVQSVAASGSSDRCRGCASPGGSSRLRHRGSPARRRARRRWRPSFAVWMGSRCRTRHTPVATLRVVVAAAAAVIATNGSNVFAYRSPPSPPST
jgi:hypothetical protein